MSIQFKRVYCTYFMELMLFFLSYYQIIISQRKLISIIILVSDFISKFALTNLIFTQPGTKSCQYFDFHNSILTNKATKSFNHCFTCDSCIYIRDHHCIWLNNCIGKRNKLSFVIYLMSKTINMLYLIIPYTTYLKLMKSINLPIYILLLSTYLISLFIVFLLSLYHIVIYLSGTTSKDFINKIERI